MSDHGNSALAARVNTRGEKTNAAARAPRTRMTVDERAQQAAAKVERAGNAYRRIEQQQARAERAFSKQFDRLQNQMARATTEEMRRATSLRTSQLQDQRHAQRAATEAKLAAARKRYETADAQWKQANAALAQRTLAAATPKAAAPRATTPRASGSRSFAPRPEGLGQLANPRDIIEAYSHFGRYQPASGGGRTYWRSDPRGALEQALAKETPATLRALARSPEFPGGAVKLPAKATAEQMAARLATAADERIHAARRAWTDAQTQYDSNLTRFTNETTPGRPGYVGWENYEARRLAHVAEQDALKARIAELAPVALPRPSVEEHTRALAMQRQYVDANRELEQSQAAMKAAQDQLFEATHDTVKSKFGEVTKLYTGQAKARLGRIERARAARDAIQQGRADAERRASEAAHALQDYKLNYHGDAYSTRPIEPLPAAVTARLNAAAAAPKPATTAVIRAFEPLVQQQKGRSLDQYLADAAREYHASAPAVARYLTDLRQRITQNPTSVSELELTRTLPLYEGNPHMAWMQPNYAQNFVYKTKDLLGMDTTGMADF